MTLADQSPLFPRGRQLVATVDLPHYSTSYNAGRRLPTIDTNTSAEGASTPVFQLAGITPLE
jgi:hypothetical protein